MIDFFISYTSADKQWATWIAYVLEEEGFKTVIQAWDFVPGSNFVLKMQEATSQARRTIAVLSPAYLKSSFAQPEWAAAFSDDPKGLQRKLVPVRVEQCEPDGILKSIVYVDLVSLGERAAREELLAKLGSERLKPSGRPAFPGRSGDHHFPGPSVGDSGQLEKIYEPKIKKPLSDLDRKRFLAESFHIIKSYFSTGLLNLREKQSNLEYGLDEITSREFIAEIYVDGKSKCHCRIRLGGIFGEGAITFAEGTPERQCHQRVTPPSGRRQRTTLGSNVLYGLGVTKRQTYKSETSDASRCR